MKNKLIAIALIVAALALTVFIHQKNAAGRDHMQIETQPLDAQTGHYEITDADNGRTIAFGSGQAFEISLTGLGGGAQWGSPDYDTAVLHLDTHYHTPPESDAPGSMIGDMWAFTPVKEGATDITIKDDRNLGNGSIQFKVTVVVK